MNELKRQLDVKMGDTKGHAQNVMSKIEKNKRTQRPAKKSWMPYFTIVAVIALACFLFFLCIRKMSQIKRQMIQLLNHPLKRKFTQL